MATRKTLYVDANGDYIESTGTFEVVDHINSSAGVADAGKPIVLDAAGLIDSSMIDFGSIDHGSLSGLGDDDHTQYLLVSGTRAMTGALDMGTFKVTNMADGTADTDGVTVRQLTNAVNGIDWKDSARLATQANINLALAPALIDNVAPANGDRILVKEQTDLTQNGIYVYNGAGAAMTRSADADEDSEVTAMMTVAVEEGDTDANRVYTVTSSDPLTIGVSDIVFGVLPVNTFTGGDGIDIVGTLISVDILAGGGLKFVGGELAVEPADFAGNGLIDDGSDNLAIDFASVFTIDAADAKAIEASKLASTTNGEGASIIGLEDASAYFTGNQMEAAMNELEAQIGGLTSSTFNFSENNVLADNDSIYPALEKLDLRFGDLSSNANGEGASIIGIEDSANNFTSTTVEGALAELSDEIKENGVVYTAGTGGVTIGDMVYVSANDVASVYDDITVSEVVVGIALETVTAGTEFKVLANDTIIPGILGAATAGTKYFWDGTGYVNTLGGFSAGDYIWLGGVAKNATDAHVQVTYVKRQS